METDPSSSREALNELLKKLRVAQDDILQNARSDSFAAFHRRVELCPESEPRRAEYRAAFDFLKQSASLDDETLVRDLERFIPLFVDMRRFYREEDPDCALLDYVSFVAARIGEIPEDRFFIAHSADAGATGEAAEKNLTLTRRLVGLALGIPDEDLKCLTVRTLLGGVSYLRAEEEGLDGDGGRDESGGESEIYAAASEYGVPVPVIDRAMRLVASLARMTSDRRRRRKK